MWEFMYDVVGRDLYSRGGQLVLDDVSLDEAASYFLGVVIKCRL